MGQGTRVTLTRAPDAGTPIHTVPPIDQEPARKVFTREVAQIAQAASEDVQRVQGMIQEFLKPGAKKPGKADLEAMYNTLLRAGDHFHGKMDHLLKNFQEAMEETTEAAKSEVEIFVSSIAQSTGLEALRKSGMPALGHDDPNA